MTRKEAYRETLRNFRTGKIDILVGTPNDRERSALPQCDARRIINADLALHLPDFRAGERTFQLLTQVAGRAGRGETPGEVFIQTYTPFSPIDPVRPAPRFRRLFPAGTRISRALRFPAVQARNLDHRPFGARRSREIVSRNVETPFERSVAGPIHFRRCNARATGKITGSIPVPHPDPGRSHHAPDPARPRNAR